MKRRDHDSRLKLPLDKLFLSLGLFTVSWDRLATLPVGPLNLKLPVIMFALALATSFSPWERRPLARSSRPFVIVLVAMITWIAIRGSFAPDPGAVVAALARIVAGCLVPLLALCRVLRTARDLIRALEWLLAGVTFAAAFGIYQLVAAYAGLPQFIEYSALSGGAARISSFSYEAASFVIVIVAGAAAWIALFAAGTLRSPLLTGAPIALAGILANARTTFILVPTFLFIGLPLRASARLRALAVGLSVVAVLGAVLVVALRPSVVSFVAHQVASIFDPNEASSNSRRLTQYRVGLSLVSDHWWTGIGANNLYFELGGNSFGAFDGETSADVVANNIWIQAGLDGGLPLIVLTLAVCVLAARMWWKVRRVTVARSLAGAWISIVAIAGMLQSNFYATICWVLLGLAIVARENHGPVAGPAPAAGANRAEPMKGVHV